MSSSHGGSGDKKRPVGARSTTDPPLSLGKPSLRRRLEAYYQQVAPEQIIQSSTNKNDNDEWKERFDKIWEKFGGTVQGEQRLKAKLEKKYGSVVQLQIVEGKNDETSTLTSTTTVMPQSSSNPTESTIQHPEEYYALTEHQRGSGILSFTNPHFDPMAALACMDPNHNADDILAANPWLQQPDGSSVMLFDRVEQCRSLLPRTDPLFRPASITTTRKSTETTTTTALKSKAPPPFVAIASSTITNNNTGVVTGPFSILYQAMMRRKRVRVLVRYVNGIRGTLTGHLLAFDKHFNLILKDATEVYSPRSCHGSANGGAGAGAGAGHHHDGDDDNVDQNNYNDDGKSNVEREIERRRQAYHQPTGRPRKTFLAVAGKDGTVGAHKSADDNVGSNTKADHSSSSSSSWTCRQRFLPQVLIRGDNVVLVYKPEMERSSWPQTRQSPNESIYRKISCSCQRQEQEIPPHLRVGTPGSLSLTVRRSGKSSGRDTTISSYGSKTTTTRARGPGVGESKRPPG